VAKDTVFNLELNFNNNNAKNNIENNNNKESKMSDLFDIPNNNKIKQKDSKSDIEKKNNLINIIKRLEKLDNKYNKFFDMEDKNELKNIILELSK
jgi:hypothetical protein